MEINMRFRAITKQQLKQISGGANQQASINEKKEQPFFYTGDSGYTKMNPSSSATYVA
jgi:hypothetical protein